MLSLLIAFQQLSPQSLLPPGLVLSQVPSSTLTLAVSTQSHPAHPSSLLLACREKSLAPAPSELQTWLLSHCACFSFPQMLAIAAGFQMRSQQAHNETYLRQVSSVDWFPLFHAKLRTSSEGWLHAKQQPSFSPSVHRALLPGT